MRDGEPRPQRGAMAAIEDEKLLGMTVMERVHDAAAQVFAETNVFGAQIAVAIADAPRPHAVSALNRVTTQFSH